jgi:mono/diheme cytochrome c family protein
MRRCDPIVGFVARRPRCRSGRSQGQTRDVFSEAKYDGYCASCHGVASKGDGTLAASLKKPPISRSLAEERRKFRPRR